MQTNIDFTLLNKRQEEAINTIFTLNKLFLGWDVGVGKTRTSVKFILQMWQREGVAKPCLIVCPPTVYTSFIEMFSELGIPKTHYEVIDNTTKWEDIKVFKEKSKYWKPILVLSYARFKSDDWLRRERFKNAQGYREYRGVGLINLFQPYFIFFDECHALKNIKSQTTKKAMLTATMPFIKYRLMGSATYASSKVKFKDLFSQFYVLDAGETFGKSELKFRIKYFKDLNFHRRGTEGYFPNEVFDESKRNEIADLVKDRFSLLKKEDVGVKMPSLSTHIVRLDMTDEQRKVYERVIDELRVDFIETKLKKQKGEISAQQFYTHTMSKMNALRQICCGFLYSQDEDVKKVMRIPTKKILALEKGISMLNYTDKFIIWSVYIESFAIIRELVEKMGIKYVEVHGSVTSKKRQKAINLFKNRPEYRCLIAHPASGGAGLNLQQSNYSFYYSQDYSYINAEQSKGRNFRVGSVDFHKNVSHIYLRTKNTIETEIQSNLRKKSEIVNAFENYIRGKDVQ